MRSTKVEDSTLVASELSSTAMARIRQQGRVGDATSDRDDAQSCLGQRQQQIEQHEVDLLAGVVGGDWHGWCWRYVRRIQQPPWWRNAQWRRQPRGLGLVSKLTSSCSREVYTTGHRCLLAEPPSW
ncbi:hypothetical protein E2562_009926 [Oryza meyeriana var. granulata]|uniref:Uncharacterized protein n=1 Tax=Oryza meyeriana var. granulata TaxID=110450 RepID=A0A6G1BU46_9ORYZ|nr:hypothetical protein E2562_009926 [Oryza meyeriana var. granulata]